MVQARMRTISCWLVGIVLSAVTDCDFLLEIFFDGALDMQAERSPLACHKKVLSSVFKNFLIKFAAVLMCFYVKVEFIFRVRFGGLSSFACFEFNFPATKN